MSEPDRGRRRRRGVWTGAALAVVLATSVAAWLLLGSNAPQPRGILPASGRIEGDQAAVGAKVGGTVTRVAVNEGARVERGALIVELASDTARAELRRAEHLAHTAREELAAARARLAGAEREAEVGAAAVALAREDSRARIAEAEAARESARAEVREAEATEERARKDHRRVEELYDRQLVAASELDQARAARLVAEARVEAARSQLRQAGEALNLAQASRLAITVKEREAAAAREQPVRARAEVEAARARVQTAEAAIAGARAALRDLVVEAPFAGTILRRLVQPGEVVAAGTPLVTLVDLSRLYAKVYVTEADIGLVRLDAPARVYADAFPSRFFEAVVSEVGQKAEFTPRDVHMKDERTTLVFAVKLALATPAGLLKPGMPVDARVRLVDGALWGDGLPAP